MSSAARLPAVSTLDRVISIHWTESCGRPTGATRISRVQSICGNGEIKKVRIQSEGSVRYLRFSHDGASLFVANSKTISRCARDGSVIWSTSLAEYGALAVTRILSNESGSHVCVPLSATKRAEWGEDIIISVDKGKIEKTIVRHRGPPARLATDWFGDRLLTHTGEIVDFFSGEVVGNVNPK